MALDGVNGVGKIDLTAKKSDAAALEEQKLNSVYGNGYKGEKVSDEEVIKQKQHTVRLNTEQQELDNKGINAPAERTKHLMQKDIESGRLKWVPEQNALFGLVKTGGYYEYRTEDEGLYGVETYNEIAQRYGLPEDKFKKDGNYVSPDGRIYDGRIKLRPEDMPLPAE